MQQAPSLDPELYQQLEALPLEHGRFPYFFIRAWRSHHGARRLRLKAMLLKRLRKLLPKRRHAK